jgi:hypothetical protein
MGNLHIYIPFIIKTAKSHSNTSKKSSKKLKLQGKLPDLNSLQKYTLLIKLNLED